MMCLYKKYRNNGTNDAKRINIAGKFTSLLLVVFFHIYSYAQEVSVVTEHLPPFQSLSEDGKLTGYSTDVIHELFNITGDTAKIRVLPWARAYKEVKETKNTLIYSISRTTTRETMFEWVGSLMPLYLYVWGLEDFTENITSLEQISPYIIAVSTSTSAGEFIASMNFPYAYYSVNEEQTMKMLFSKRVDLLVGNTFLFRIRANNLGFNFAKMKKVIAIKELEANLNIAFNKNSDKALVERFKKAFKLLITTGKLAELQQKWHIPLKEELSPLFKKQ